MGATVKINRLGKFDLNPRGNLWLKDENRFGHKLLSKMGWSQGKGLGKNENGIAENLKVKRRNGNTGVGWSEKFPLAAESDEYDAVLANLNDKFNSDENKMKDISTIKSLELRSQQFKNRLHYGKFVRGKDVCRYSEKDMNSIFITKKPKSEPAPVKSSVTNIESSSTDDEKLEVTPTYKSQMSMKEYFEMKMKKKLGEKRNSSTSADIENTELVLNSDVSRKKYKSKRLKLDPEISESSSNEGNVQDIIDLTQTENVKSSSETEVSSRKKNKTKKRKEKSKLELDSRILEESSSEGEKSTHIISSTGTDSIEESCSKIETCSRKRNKTPHRTEKSKRLKLDPELDDKSSSSDTSSEGSSYDATTYSNNVDNSCTSSRLTKVSKKTKRKSALEKEERRKKVETEVINISRESSSESDENIAQNDVAFIGEFPSNKNGVSREEHKMAVKRSKKIKPGKLEKLKTCLKARGSYFVHEEPKKVSFNEHVFYRQIEGTSRGESEAGVCLAAIDETLDMAPAEVESEVAEISNADVKVELCNGVNSRVENAQKTEGPCDEESDDVPNCMNLPKCDNSNYNSWLENQRLATKMKLYQNMIKKIKKHPVLKTSNMLDLKGYGNWGF